MSGKLWLDTVIPTPTLFSPNSSNPDLSSISNADESSQSTLGKDIVLSLKDISDNGNIEREIEWEIEKEEEPLVTPKELKGWYIYSAAVR